MNADDATESFFSNVCSRFGQGWKSDIPHLFGALQTDEDKELADMEVDTTVIWNGIQYGNLLLNGHVTEAGFRMLFKDFLLERGALPVGEIGKMLQDSTGITTLSTSLKLKFGGLKKFLEKYPDDFVIGVNHPFNPHVYLKETLSAEDVHAISKGEIPKSVLIKFKKVQKEIVRRKKAGLAVAGTTSGEHTTPISGMTTNLPPNIVAVTPTPGAKPVVVSVGPMDNSSQSSWHMQRVPTALSTNQPGLGNRALAANNRGNKNGADNERGVMAVRLSKGRHDHNYSDDNNYNNHNNNRDINSNGYGSPPLYSKHQQQQQQQYKRSNSTDQFTPSRVMSLTPPLPPSQPQLQQSNNQYQNHHRYSPYSQMREGGNTHNNGNNYDDHDYTQSLMQHHQPLFQQQHQQQQQYQQRSISADEFPSRQQQIASFLLPHDNKINFDGLRLDPLNHSWHNNQGANMNVNLNNLNYNDTSTPSSSSNANDLNVPLSASTSTSDESSQNESFLSKILGRNL